MRFLPGEHWKSIEFRIFNEASENRVTMAYGFARNIYGSTHFKMNDRISRNWHNKTQKIIRCLARHSERSRRNALSIWKHVLSLLSAALFCVLFMSVLTFYEGVKSANLNEFLGSSQFVNKLKVVKCHMT